MWSEPPVWQQCCAPDGRAYWFNRTTGASSWSPPDYPPSAASPQMVQGGVPPATSPHTPATPAGEQPAKTGMDILLVKQSRSDFHGVLRESDPVPSGVNLQPERTRISRHPPGGGDWTLATLTDFVRSKLNLSAGTLLILRYVDGDTIQRVGDDDQVDMFMEGFPVLKLLEATEVAQEVRGRQLPPRHTASPASLSTSGAGAQAAALLTPSGNPFEQALRASAARAAASPNADTQVPPVQAGKPGLPSETQRTQLAELRALEVRLAALHESHAALLGDQPAADEADQPAADEADTHEPSMQTAEANAVGRDIADAMLRVQQLKMLLKPFNLDGELQNLVQPDAHPAYSDVVKALVDARAVSLVKSLITSQVPGPKGAIEARSRLVTCVVEPAAKMLDKSRKEAARELRMLQQEVQALRQKSADAAADDNAPAFEKEAAAQELARAELKVGQLSEKVKRLDVPESLIEVVLWNNVPAARALLSAADGKRADKLMSEEKKNLHTEMRGRLQLQSKFNQVTQTCTFSEDGQSVSCTKGKLCSKAKQGNACVVRMSTPWHTGNWSKVGCTAACFGWTDEAYAQAEEKAASAKRGKGVVRAEISLEALKAAPQATPAPSMLLSAQLALAQQQEFSRQLSRLKEEIQGSPTALLSSLEEELLIPSGQSIQHALNIACAIFATPFSSPTLQHNVSISYMCRGQGAGESTQRVHFVHQRAQSKLAQSQSAASSLPNTSG